MTIVRGPLYFVLFESQKYTYPFPAVVFGIQLLTYASYSSGWPHKVCLYKFKIHEFYKFSVLLHMTEHRVFPMGKAFFENPEMTTTFSSSLMLFLSIPLPSPLIITSCQSMPKRTLHALHGQKMLQRVWWLYPREVSHSKDFRIALVYIVLISAWCGLEIYYLSIK